MPPRSLATRSGSIDLSRPALVGILNATPDSFSDGGACLDPGHAAAVAAEMVAEGASALDLGAESTRPGAIPVSTEEELRRLLPVLRRVRAAVPVPLSVDTRKTRVAAAAIEAGADVINDVSAGRFDGGMLELCGRTGTPIVLMHMQGEPATMQHAPRYADVVAEVISFLRERAAAAATAGVIPERIILDPGIGFGKTAADNFRLLAALDAVAALGYPVLVGVSRKRFLGPDREPGERIFGTAAAVAWAAAHGAQLLRVHDVRAMAEVVAVTGAIIGA